jgi:inner membrane protein COX18
MALMPLISSWTHQLRKETMAEVGHLGPAVAQRTLVKKMRKKRKEIYERWDCGMWKSYISWLQLPIWLTAIEAIRRMCGKEVGLLGMIFGTSGEGKDIPEALATSGVGKELSFATEGALWFPDLLVPDPLLILPFMLSGVMFLNLANTSGAKNPSVGQRRLLNALKIVALAIGPLTLHVPSAMLVYWISSSSFALAQALVLDKLMPVKPPVVPCKPRHRVANPGDMLQRKI